MGKSLYENIGTLGLAQSIADRSIMLLFRISLFFSSLQSKLAKSPDGTLFISCAAFLSAFVGVRYQAPYRVGTPVLVNHQFILFA